MNIDEIAKDVITSMQNNFHETLKNGLVLTRYQMEVLDKYKIDYNSMGSISELIYEIDEALEECDYPDDLDIVSSELSEYNYYNNTNK